jgi:ankyrin repeat protein
MEFDEQKKLFDMIKNQKYDNFKTYLLDNINIDLNIRDESNNYLLTYAVLFNKLDLIKLLVNNGAKLDILDNEGRTILFIPIKYNYIEALLLLLKLNKKAISVPLVDYIDQNGNLPLHYSIINSNLKITKILIEYGSDVNSVNSKKNNSLHLGIYSKSLDIIRLLLKSGVNINSKTVTGETALHLACNFELEDIVSLLLEKGINVNAQEYDNEFTALNYSVNLNNINIGTMLIENNADPNIQDFNGNSPLHYAVLENNYLMFDLLINNSKTKNKINYNLYNLDGKIPMHLAFNVNSSNKKFYIQILIEGSDLNLQDNNGNTCLHYLIKTDIWKDYKEILKNKKLNIFIKNGIGDAPIDYIKKDDLADFIDCITQSYLYIIRNHNSVWKEDWQNLCKKELFRNSISNDELKKLDNIKIDDDKQDMCYKFVSKKIRKIIKNKKYEPTYPIEKNSICLLMKEDKPLEFCTYTGVTLDILVGLIYLLEKHTNSCSTLTTKFIENEKLCKYYKSLGISSGSKCEFLNFEIVWVYQKLHFPKDFINEFKKCQSNNQIRFIIIPLGIELRTASHANYLIYDIKKRELERFEPHGSTTPYKFNYNPELLDTLLRDKFIDIVPEIKYISPKQFLPKIGFQLFDTYENKCKKIGDPGGFCGLWATWYVDLRMQYYDVERSKLVRHMINEIKLNNLSFKNLIRNYSNSILEIRDSILIKGNITINDWINENYTEDQITTVIDQLKERISLLNRK